MATTAIRGGQIQDGTVQRLDLDVATAGKAVVAKIIQGTGISLSSTGADSGTGDVTVNATGGGTGDVVGPASAVDGQFALFNGATGKLIKAATGTGLLSEISGVGNLATVNAPLLFSSNILSLDTTVDLNLTFPQHFTLTDASTSSVGFLLYLVHNSTGVPANGLGVGLAFQAEDSVGNNSTQAIIQSVWTNVISASKSSNLTFIGFDNGTQNTLLRLFGTGGMGVGTTAVNDPGNGVINAGTGYKTAGTEYPSTANGIVKRTGAYTYSAAVAGTDFQAPMAATKITVLTSGTGATYNVTAGARAMWVEAIGAGGGGGGAVATASNACCGGGGGGGSYAALYIASPAASYTYTVGAAGVAGTTAGGTGGTGGNTTFGTLTGNGGVGGGGFSTTGNTIAVNGVAGGGGSAAGTGGNIALVGGDGMAGYRWDGTHAISGQGGNAPRGGGNTQGRTNQGNGIGGGNYGAGGGGAVSYNATGQSGGPGGGGVIIVTEFF
jgi:hypothetical protein